MTQELQGKQQKVNACLDTAIACTGIVLRSLGKMVTDEQIGSNWANGYAYKDVMRVLSRHKLKVRMQTVDEESLTAIPVPAIAQLKNGRYIVMGKYNGERIMFVDPLVGRPEYVALEQFMQVWDGNLLIIELPFSIKDYVRKLNLQWFFDIIIQYKQLLGETLVAAFFLQLFGLMMPLFTQIIIDKVVPNNGLSTLDILAGVLLLLIIFQTSMSTLRTYLFNHTTNKIDVILGTKLFRRLAGLPLQYFETRRVGDTLMRISAMSSIRDFLTGSALTSLLDTFFSIVFIIVMLNYSAALTAVSLMVVPLYFIQNVVVTPIYQRKLEKAWGAGAASNAFLVEAITGIHTMKSMAIEPQFVYRWEKLLSRYVQATFDNSVFNFIINNSSSLIQNLVGFSIFWYGGHMVMEGSLTIGQLIAFQMLSSQANSSLSKMFGLWQSVQQVGLAIMRLGDILSVAPEAVYTPQGLAAHTIKGNIVLKDVKFRYQADRNLVLDNLNITIQAGMRVGIVGRSGSGKSTVTKLIQRLYLLEAGSIMIDGVDLMQMNVEWLRRQIGVVLQDNYLFHGSVRDNISTAAPSADMEEVVKAAKIAGAHEFILELTEGYDTQVGERGMSLSGGQRQRIAIARALLTNPKILIFDEATSALDYESERIILDNLDNICADRTMLMIAHRLTAVQSCDLIIVLDHGQVVEQGNHEQLMAQQGQYYNLYLQQEG